MGVRHLDWAWQQNASAVQRLVLLALADNSDEYGCAYRSVPELAAKLHMDDRSVQRHIRALERRGLLRVERRPHPKWGNLSNVYRLAIDLRATA